MCCRLRLETKELKHRGGGLFGSNPLTGSIGVVTLNLPRIGYLSESEEDFFERLERLMDIAKTSLEIKRKVLERFTDGGLYPYSKYYLSSIKEKTGLYWSNHFSTIGIIGMNEAIANAKWLTSKGIWTEEGKAFALKVMELMREKLLKYQEETGNLYNLEATPAEGTSYRLAKIDKEKYPDIFTQGKEYPYYTNSTWLPVNFTESITYLLDHQTQLQCNYTGGTVAHLFLGEKPESERLKSFLKAVFERYKLPYISITPTFSVCPECGYIEGEQAVCPKCGSECEVYSRVVGYLRPVSNWNDGKKEEFKERKYMTGIQT
jgi:ribonucleoside-triphosphate reductase